MHSSIWVTSVARDTALVPHGPSLPACPPWPLLPPESQQALSPESGGGLVIPLQEALDGGPSSRSCHVALLASGRPRAPGFVGWGPSGAAGHPCAWLQHKRRAGVPPLLDSRQTPVCGKDSFACEPSPAPLEQPRKTGQASSAADLRWLPGLPWSLPRPQRGTAAPGPSPGSALGDPGLDPLGPRRAPGRGSSLAAQLGLSPLPAGPSPRPPGRRGSLTDLGNRPVPSCGVTVPGSVNGPRRSTPAQVGVQRWEWRPNSTSNPRD